MTKINTVLFDFDGTIMDTNDLIFQSWQHTFRTVEGKERTLEEIAGSFGEPLACTMGKVLPQIPVEKGIEIYRSYHYDNFSDLIEIFPGIPELLEALKSKGYKLGIVTSRLRNTTLMGLDKYELAKYFETVITCDDTDKHKPEPEPVLIALEQLRSKPEETVMVGDSIFDMQSAKAAGLKAAVLVNWAIAFPDEHKTGEHAPDYILENAMDLLEIL